MEIQAIIGKLGDWDDLMLFYMHPCNKGSKTNFSPFGKPTNLHSMSDILKYSSSSLQFRSTTQVPKILNESSGSLKKLSTDLNLLPLTATMPELIKPVIKIGIKGRIAHKLLGGLIEKKYSLVVRLTIISFL